MSTLECCSDAQLLSRSRTGDRQAFACLVDRHKNAMVNYLTRLTGDRDRAEDLAQETFLRVYSKRGRYSEEGKLAAYMYRIATNLFRSQLRRERRWQRLRPVFTGPRPSRSPAMQQTEVLQSELGRRVQQALSRLPPDFRVPLVLHELEEWPYREIANLLRLREGTVKSRIHRGRKLLRAELDDYWNGDSS